MDPGNLTHGTFFGRLWCDTRLRVGSVRHLVVPLLPLCTCKRSIKSVGSVPLLYTHIYDNIYRSGHFGNRSTSGSSINLSYSLGFTLGGITGLVVWLHTLSY